MKKEKARRSKMLHFAVTEEEARIIDAKMKQLEIRKEGTRAVQQKR